MTFSVIMISLGTCIASAGEIEFNTIGVLLYLIAAVAEGVKLVLSQKLLSNMKFNAFEALYYFAPATTAIMLSCSLLLEGPRLITSGKFLILGQHYQSFALAGILGFCVNIATFFVIGRTNAVMIKVMSTARNAGLVLYSVMVHGEIVTVQQGSGYLWALAFFGLYNYFKMNKL